MDKQHSIEQAKKNIWQAIDDYCAHTSQRYIMDSVTEKFVDRLARDNAYAKTELRNLFRKSPVWDENLDALVINGSRTHNPDYMRIQNLADDIFRCFRWNTTSEKRELIDRAICFFSRPHENKASSIAAIQALAPQAYAEGKKPSRVFVRFAMLLAFPMMGQEASSSDSMRSLRMSFPRGRLISSFTSLSIRHIFLR